VEHPGSEAGTLTPAQTPSPQAHSRDAYIENVIGGSGLSAGYVPATTSDY
jgi:hypothetical protein